VVLLAAGFLASAAPALEAVQAQQRLGYIGGYQDKGVRFNLWITPARAGYNETAVDVTRLPPGVDPSQIQVQIRLLMPDQDMGISQVMASPVGRNRWEAKGSYLSLSGRWEMEVTVRRPGADDVVHIFLFQVQPQSDESSQRLPSSEDTNLNGSSLTRLSGDRMVGW